MARITVLLGSPRRQGNTERLADAFLSGIDRTTHDVTVLRATEQRIHGCTGCNFCRGQGNGVCALKDDMGEVYARLAETDVLVIATPVYFYGVPSQLKALIDRLHNPIRRSFPIRKLVLLAVCADRSEEAFAPVRAMYDATLRYFSLEDGGTVTVSGVEEKGDIDGNPGLERARALGAGLI